MRISREELARRLEEAARARAVLRRATREWHAVGDRLLAERKHGPGGSDGRERAGEDASTS